MDIAGFSGLFAFLASTPKQNNTQEENHPLHYPASIFALDF